MIFMFGGRNDRVYDILALVENVLPVLNAERIRHDK